MPRRFWISRLLLTALFFVLMSATLVYAQYIITSAGKKITFYVPHDAPGCARSIEGCIATSRPGLNGRSVPICLDDVRNGAPYVTLASDQSNYGKYYHMGTITYVSALDNKRYTVENVVGYVHDTGGAFKGRPDKLDVCTTICRGCSDGQAGAYASGKNISYQPSTQGAADRTATSPFSFANTGWLTPPVGQSSPTPYGSAPTPAGALSTYQPVYSNYPIAFTPVFFPTSSPISFVPTLPGQLAPAWQQLQVVAPGLSIAQATISMNPRETTRGEIGVVSWSSVGMASNSCRVTVVSGGKEVLVGQGNTGSRQIKVSPTSSIGTLTFTLRCTTLSASSIERTATLSVR